MFCLLQEANLFPDLLGLTFSSNKQSKINFQKDFMPL